MSRFYPPDFQQMEPLQGRFSFWLTATGNLLGEYFNNHTPQPHVEAAQRIDLPQAPGFAGRYQSVWLEPDLAPRLAVLTITATEDPDGLYRVDWMQEEEGEAVRRYEGEARIYGGILAGDYRLA